MSFLYSDSDKLDSPYPVPADRQGFFDLWMTQLQAFWMVDPLNESLDLDRRDWNHRVEISGDVKHMVKILILILKRIDKYAMIYSGDTIASKIDSIFVKSMLVAQANMEAIHSWFYGRIGDMCFDKNTEAWASETEAAEIPEIRELLDWAVEVEEGRMSLTDILLGAIAIEVIILQAMFLPIYALKTKSWFNGLTSGNELVGRDEWLHGQGYFEILAHLDSKPDKEMVRKVFDRAINLTEKLLKRALPKPIMVINISAEVGADYARHVANTVCEHIGYEHFYTPRHEIPSFMDLKDLPQFASFHQIRPTTYLQMMGVDGERADQVLNSGID